MIADKKLESLDHSSARLTVTVDKEAAKQEYDTLLQKYAKTAQIKGFRRGKVPPRVLEQKFGESIRSEAGMQLIESSLKEVFEEIEQKPLQYEPPELQEEIALEIGNDFTFTVTYDVFPDFELGEYTSIEVEKPSVTVDAEDIDRELEQIREQNAIVVDKENDAAVEEQDIVTVNYAEVDEKGEVVEDTERQDFTFTVGTGYNRYKIDEEIVGLKPQVETIIEKHYDDEFEDEELKGRDVKLKVTVTQIKTRDMPELDDELAQDVSDEFETLDDLKKDIETRLNDAAEARVRQRMIDSILESIVEQTTIDLPESMVKSELESSWRNFVSRSGVSEEQMESFLSAQERTKAALLEEWRSGAEQNIRSRLVMNKIIEAENIEADDEAVDEAVKEQAERSNMDVETARQQLEQANMLDYIRSQVADRKLFDFLLESAKTKKGEKLKLLDLLQDNQ